MPPTCAQRLQGITTNSIMTRGLPPVLILTITVVRILSETASARIALAHTVKVEELRSREVAIAEGIYKFAPVWRGGEWHLATSQLHDDRRLHAAQHARRS